jgi:hypothetical protein
MASMTWSREISWKPSGWSQATITKQLAEEQTAALVELDAEAVACLSQLEHPVSAYLNGLAPSSRRLC